MVGSYQFARRHPGNLGLACAECANKYSLRGHPALRGLGSLRAIGDATGAGVPAGTVLAYSASWPGSSLTRTIDSRPNTIQAAIQSTLAGKWGVVIDNQQHTTSDIIHVGGYSFILQVHTTSDYGAPGDVQSIIDGEIYNYLGVMPQSTIRVVQAVAGPGVSLTQQLPPSTAAAIAAAQAGYQDAVSRGDTASAAQFAAEIQQLTGSNPQGVTGWFSQNWPWLAAVAGGLIVAREVL